MAQIVLKKLMSTVTVCALITSLFFFFGYKSKVNHTNIAFINGWIFNGDKFVKKDIYSKNGKITFNKPTSIDTIVDASEKYIIPPFGEAHNHNLGDESNIDRQLKLYLSKGVFYSKNLHYIPGRTQRIESKVNTTNSVDVIYAHTGLIATGGHAHTLYKNLYNWKVLPEFSSIAQLDTKAYIIVDSEKDIEEKWSELMAMKPGIIKVYLEYSDEFDLRKNDPKYGDEKGIDPKLLEIIVEKANNNNLRVSAHIESVEDFRNAVKAGVHEVAHLPGFRISKFKTINDYKLTAQDAINAKNKGIQVITTTALSNSMNNDDPNLLKLIKDNQVANLILLKEHGVKIVIGSDILNSTSVKEAINLLELNVFSNLELLKMLSEDTPINIFPERKIGFLKEGYEASFLILNNNPITQFEEIKNIDTRFKQGQFILE